jgi:hypothetical protein
MQNPYSIFNLRRDAPLLHRNFKRSPVPDLRAITWRLGRIRGILATGEANEMPQPPIQDVVFRSKKRLYTCYQSLCVLMVNDAYSCRSWHWL